jgi:hypothetical protein
MGMITRVITPTKLDPNHHMHMKKKYKKKNMHSQTFAHSYANKKNYKKLM